MGWGTFLIAYATLAVTLFCPGYFLLRSARLGREESLCLAPAVTIVLIVILGVIYARLGIYGSFSNMVAIPMTVTVVLCLLSRPWRRKGSEAQAVDWSPVLIYLLVGIVMTFLFFGGNLENRLGSFQPDNDNSFHLSLIKSIADSGDYSLTGASVYHASSVAPFTGSGSFYPAAFHFVAATAVNLFSLSVPLAENALGAVIASLVWPLGTYWLLSHICGKDRVALFAGALSCMTIIAFPWRFFTWGPLFPNLLALALVPGAMGVFVELFRCVRRRGGAVIQLVLFVVAMAAIGVSHPNGVFTLGLLLVPYMVHLIWHMPIGKPRPKGSHTQLEGNAEATRHRLLRLVLSLVLLFLVAAIWVVAYKLPALQSVVTYVWAPYENFGLGILGALTLKTAGNRAQSVVSILLLLGLVGCLRNWRDYGWVFCLFALVAVQFAISASVAGPIKQLTCGFWYGDPNRIAANVALVAVPVVAVGTSFAVSLLKRVLHAEPALPEATIAGATIVVLAVLVGSSVLGHASEEEKGFQLATTASFDYSNMLEYKYSSTTPKAYDAKEQAFVDKVLQVVPEGSLILNLPNDGSCFAYSVQGANVFYKDVTSPHIFDAGQSDAAKIIRRNLFHLSDYASVQEAVRELDAHYLLVLDQGLGVADDARVLPYYSSQQWRGIVSVNDDTPGFEVVLAQDDMRLYRLIY